MFGPMGVKVEVCVSGLAEANAALEAGVDHIEWCTWPECGGTTPSLGSIHILQRAVPMPTRILVRPTPGHFHYTAEELDIMLADVEAISRLTKDMGIVVGALDADGLPHVPFMERVIDITQGMEITFHRAIDHARDMERAMAILLDLGVHRVLTSGGAVRALDGAPMLARMVVMAWGRTTVAAAGGILPADVVELVRGTGVGEVHFAARGPSSRPPKGVAMSSGDARAWDTVPDREKVQGVLDALMDAGLR